MNTNAGNADIVSNTWCSLNRPPPRAPECQNKDVEQLISAFGVSSETTRQANLNSARKKATVAHKEKQHEEYKQMLHHDD